MKARVGSVRGGQYRIGRSVLREGVRLTIVHYVAGVLGRGYKRVHATADGGRIVAGLCSCRVVLTRRHLCPPVVRAADLAVEDDFFVCGKCRMRLK